MNNYSIKKKSLEEIDLPFIQEAIYKCYEAGITSVAPLGFSGDTIILFEAQKDIYESGRKAQVSIRNYCGSAEFLITDLKGSFLFYGRFDINLGVDFLANSYFTIFNSVKDKIETELPKVSDFEKMEIPITAQKSWGFDMLRAWQASKLKA